jgi:hypothetical protein
MRRTVKHQSPRRIIITTDGGDTHTFDADKTTCVFQMDHDGQTLNFEYGFIDLELIDEIPPELQRRFRPRFAEKIRATFDWRKVRLAACRRQDGTKGLVSGQHCGTETRGKGYTHWPGQIVPVSDAKDEAWLYDGYNDAGHKKPSDTTRVKVWTGDPQLKAAVELARSECFVYQTARAWNNITDPTILAKLISAHGEQHVRDVLRYIAGAWEGKSGACYLQNLYAISYLLRNWRTPAGKFPHSEVLKALRSLNPRTLAAATADAKYGTDSNVEKMGEKIARYIAEGVFNPRKKEENKLRHT